ncbi:MAG: hypothetical protein RL698_1854 [Pseudomonadota bacterium]
MGHLRLGELPRTRKWNDVVELVKSEANIDLVAAAALDAAEKGLHKAADDEGLNRALWLLTLIEQVADCSPDPYVWSSAYTPPTVPTIP